MVVVTVQDASCFGPAYEFTLLANADLRRCKIPNRIRMAFVTSEPYFDHLGLGGISATKGLLEPQLHDRNIKWISKLRSITSIQTRSRSLNPTNVA